MRNILSIIVVFILVSCEKEYEWKLNILNSNTIVVDAIITNENIAQHIRLTYPLDSMNALPRPLSGANVLLSDEKDTISFYESSSSLGDYYSTPFQAVVGKKYSLEITFQSNKYTANTSMVSLGLIDSFDIVSVEGLYKYIQKKVGDPQMIEVNYDWSSVPEYTAIKGNSIAKEFFYILKNVDVNQEFGTDKEIIYFPKGTRIIRKKYSLTEEHQAFLRSLLMETDWRGGVFDVQQGNVISNITNGGLGYFAVCTVAIDSFFVK